jgi:hypothetical protein
MNAGDFYIQNHIQDDRNRSLDDKLGSKSMKPTSYFCLMLILNPQILCQNRTLKYAPFAAGFFLWTIK